MFIDTHTHLYLPEFREDREIIMQRALDNDVREFYLPAIDSNHTTDMLELQELYPSSCFAMIGLHPCSVNAAYEKELAHVQEWLAKRKFAAIGEIGLDFYWDKTFIEQQYTSFNRQMELALQYNYPIVIHSRNALQECIDAVKPFAAKGLRGIFHCFGGTISEGLQIIEAGFMLGIGGVLTYKNSGLDKVIETLPLEHIVLETDAPYLTPQPFRGKRNESSYLIYIAKRLAEIKSVTLQEIADITTSNAKKIYGSHHI